MTFWLFFHPHVYYWGKLYQKGANHQYIELCPLILQEVHNNLKTASQSNYQPQLSLHWFHPNPATGPPAAFCTSAPFSFAWLCNPLPLSWTILLPFDSEHCIATIRWSPPPTWSPSSALSSTASTWRSSTSPPSERSVYWGLSERSTVSQVC